MITPTCLAVIAFDRAAHCHRIVRGSEVHVLDINGEEIPNWIAVDAAAGWVETWSKDAAGYFVYQRHQKRGLQVIVAPNISELRARQETRGNW